MLAWGHGNLGGGPLVSSYDPLMEALIGDGDFVVATYESCWVDSSCLRQGQGDFLELLKVIEYFTNSSSPESALVDQNLPVAVSGHSSGARAVLIAGSVRDNPDTYVQDDKFQDLMTPSLYAAASKIGAIISNHPDKSYDPGQTPDIENFDISQTPTLILTGSKDHIEDENSAWKDFGMMSVKDKIYLNVLDATHNEPINGHRCAGITSMFIKGFMLGDEEAKKSLYEIPDGSEFPVAEKGDRNSPQAYGYLACSSEEGVTVPTEDASFCEPFDFPIDTAFRVGVGDDNPPPLWGGSQQWSSTVKMTNPADSKDHPEWTFDYFYDEVLGADLYKHYDGQGDEVCKKVKGTKNIECWVLNANNGHSYVRGIEEGTCCIYPMHLGMVKSDWLVEDGAVYNGTKTAGYGKDQVVVDEWLAEGAYTNHYWDTADGEDRPVRFYEFKGEDLKQWDFIAESFKEGAPGDELFDIPEDCNSLCF
ncbi:hypothetical protein TL16_g12808 [Triparma laevis f. inornata]|uniref:Uncharacterized protein n=1 Tax=Triparma laevis f. inornata TaxID=1714386 RepID=A0A9W7BXC4_9STRA|nr:hypothetical protein TL16_g12808 [Triparma laevis f. inornata]